MSQNIRLVRCEIDRKQVFSFPCRVRHTVSIDVERNVEAGDAGADGEQLPHEGAIDERQLIVDFGEEIVISDVIIQFPRLLRIDINRLVLCWLNLPSLPPIIVVKELVPIDNFGCMLNRCILIHNEGESHLDCRDD